MAAAGFPAPHQTEAAIFGNPCGIRKDFPPYILHSGILRALTMLFMESWPLVAGCVCGACAGMAWAVRGRSSAVFGRSVWRGRPDRPAVALTFDDGPSESTPAILQTLAEYDIPGTFFQVGRNVERLPQIARAVASSGHAIGNHSYAHPMFCFRSPGFIELDMAKAQQTIQRHTGIKPEWFRAPFGVRWIGMCRAQERVGLRGVMWSAIAQECKWDAAGVYRRLSNGISNGVNLGLHDGRELQ